jgi:hypothetical protein
MASTPSAVLQDGRQLLDEMQENVLRADELANALLFAIRVAGSDRNTPTPNGLMTYPPARNFEVSYSSVGPVVPTITLSIA